MAEKNRNLNVVLSATDKMTTVVNSAVSKSMAKLNSLQQSTGKLAANSFAVGQSMGAVGLALAVPLVSFVKAAEEAATANARLDQVFKSMGDSSGKAAEQAKVFANALSLKIAVDDEQILAAQAKLATFENVIKNATGSSEIFDRATKAAFDLQAAGFGDASGNVVQLGKALQDPIKGMTALNKSGVTFTAQEKLKIESLVKSNKLFEAQQFLLNAVEKQVGGVAEATANDSDKMRIAFGEIQEKLGAALLPALAKLTTHVVDKLMPAFDRFMAQNGPLVESLLMGTAALAAVSLGISGVSFVFGGLFKVISLGMGAFKFLAGGIGFVVKALNILRVAALTNPVLLIVTAIAVAAFLIIRNWDKVSGFFVKLWAKIKGPTMQFVNFMKNLFLNFTPIGLIIKHWDKLVGFFKGMWTQIQNDFMAIVNFIGGLGQAFFNAGHNIAMSIWEGIKSGWNVLETGFSDLMSRIRAYLPFSPAKTGPLKDLHRIKFVETMMMGFNAQPAIDGMSGLAATMASPMAASAPVSNSSIGGSSINYAPVVNIGGGGTEQDRQGFMEMLNTHKLELLRLIESEQSKQQRKRF